MVLCNVFVWTFFVKALHQRGGSIVATVCSTATNYCGSVGLKHWYLSVSFHFENTEKCIRIVSFRQSLVAGYLAKEYQCCGGLGQHLLLPVCCSYQWDKTVRKTMLQRIARKQINTIVIRLFIDLQLNKNQNKWKLLWISYLNCCETTAPSIEKAASSLT